jgi:hypothetical protein
MIITKDLEQEQLDLYLIISTHNSKDRTQHPIC